MVGADGGFMITPSPFVPFGSKQAKKDVNMFY